jgi:hypothetical protein
VLYNNIVTISISNTINFIVEMISSIQEYIGNDPSISILLPLDSIIWDMGTLPAFSRPNTLIASIT